MTSERTDRNSDLWTIDELSARVAEALAVGYDGQSNGQISDVPNARTIRYYTTLGLIDRAAEMRGRTALYGPRHLRQLVAIKRLQLEGLSLAAIQERLAGATSETLARLARVPGEVGATGGDAASAATKVGRPAPERERSFWQSAPGELSETAPAESDDPRLQTLGAPSGSPAVQPLVGLRAGEGVTLLLEPARPLESADLAAIDDALVPLLRLLRERGLAPRLRGDRS